MDLGRAKGRWLVPLAISFSIKKIMTEYPTNPPMRYEENGLQLPISESDVTGSDSISFSVSLLLFAFQEYDMLDLAYGLTDTSRLGCQIFLTKDLDNLVVHVPPGIADARS